MSVVSPEFLGLVPGFFATDAEETVRSLESLLRLCFAEQPSASDLYMMLGYNVSVPPHVRQALLSRACDNDDLLPRICKPVLITQGAKVIVLDPVDSAAAASLVKQAQAQGVKVIAYDRPIPGAGADYYVSFDNEGIGKAIADSLVEKLKAMGAKAEDGAGVLQINGSPVDAAAGLIKKGIHSSLDNSGYPILAEYDTPDWAPPKAQQWASGQITRFPGKILGVVAANDGTAGGAIAALKAAGVDPVPPVSGNDATIAALQLIIAGDQYNTISKPSEIVAAAAANVAVKFLKGETPEAKTTLFDTPSELFVPAVVTRENLKAEIIDKKIQTAEELCAGRYAEGCKELGIIQ